MVDHQEASEGLGGSQRVDWVRGFWGNPWVRVVQWGVALGWLAAWLLFGVTDRLERELSAESCLFMGVLGFVGLLGLRWVTLKRLPVAVGVGWLASWLFMASRDSGGDEIDLTVPMIVIGGVGFVAASSLRWLRLKRVAVWAAYGWLVYWVCYAALGHSVGAVVYGLVGAVGFVVLNSVRLAVDAWRGELVMGSVCSIGSLIVGCSAGVWATVNVYEYVHYPSMEVVGRVGGLWLGSVVLLSVGVVLALVARFDDRESGVLRLWALWVNGVWLAGVLALPVLVVLS